MSKSFQDALTLVGALGLPISVSYEPSGEVELFMHTDPKSLDQSLPPLIQSAYQALELARHHARRRDDDESDGGVVVRPKNPVLAG